MPDQRPQTLPQGELPSDAPVPKVVVSRLSLYLRELQRLEAAGQQTISSGQLGTLLGFSDAQVRKDLGFFGQFGYPGVGYRCDELIRAMRDILGTNQPWQVVMVGVGNLGQALLGYRGFGRQNFSIYAAFDADPAKVGRLHAVVARPDEAGHQSGEILNGLDVRSRQVLGRNRGHRDRHGPQVLGPLLGGDPDLAKGRGPGRRGGLVGGPDDDDAWSDDRDMNNPANTANLLNSVGFSAAVAGLVNFDVNMAKCQQGNGFIQTLALKVKGAPDAAGQRWWEGV